MLSPTEKSAPESLTSNKSASATSTNAAGPEPFSSATAPHLPSLDMGAAVVAASVASAVVVDVVVGVVVDCW
eukprot:CAMPEP_0194522948 /NCGR_PEP_ID=MMETSP0253-20130528/57705_1 /TAXON_ID=2966 /ORGANISM="Noctiluca scintillans" /LENGTH=71 /DNA_ID=CAMNT_0039367437 /DNA_START=182 /DNA_END=395 /DNA_ORIENTATION=+